MAWVGRAVLEHGGLEQPRVVRLHALRRRHRGEIGRPLVPAFRAQRLPESGQHKRAEHQGGREAQNQHKRLAGLRPEHPLQHAIASRSHHA